MQRRKVLAALAGSVGLAGCSSLDAAGGAGGDGAGGRNDGGGSQKTAARYDALRVELPEGYLIEKLRYWDSETESLKFQQPERGRWLTFGYIIENLSDEPVPKPPAENFLAKSGADTFSPVSDYRGVPPEQLRPRDRVSGFKNLGYKLPGEDVNGGRAAFLTVAYDVPDTDEIGAEAEVDGETKTLDPQLYLFSDEA